MSVELDVLRAIEIGLTRIANDLDDFNVTVNKLVIALEKRAGVSK